MMYFPSSCTECCDLLRVLLHEKPIRRLGLGQIMSHNWFMVVNQRPAKKNQLLVGRKQKVQPVFFCFVSGRLIRPFQLASFMQLCVLRAAVGDSSIPPLTFASCGASKPCVASCALAWGSSICVWRYCFRRDVYILLLVAPFCLSHHGHSIPEVPVTAIQTHRPRPKLFTLWLDSRFPHRQTLIGKNGPVHLQLHHPERRSPTRLCPGSPALLSLHTTACPLTAPLLSSNLLMKLWFWASLTTMMKPHTWMK